MRAASIKFEERSVTLTGVVSHIIHTARDNRGASAIFQLNVEGQKLVTIAEFGTIRSIPLIGEIWRVTGEHVSDQTYGSQFKVENATKLQPDKSICPKVLADFLVHNVNFVGINRLWSKKLVRLYGSVLFDVLEGNNAYELTENKKLKMSGVLISNLLHGWQTVTQQSALNTFFQSKHLPLELIETTRQLLGDNAIEHIQKNPYLLYPIMSVRATNRNWNELDKTIRSQFNIKKNDRRRAVSHIESVLYSAYSQQGHMALPTKSVEEALGEAGIGFELSRLEKVEFDYQSLCINKETQTVQILGHQAIEKTVNSLLKKRFVGLKNDGKKVVVDTEPTLMKLRAIGIELAHEQLKALIDICNSSLSIIDGCTKTGKTLVVRAAIDALIENGENVRLICPSSYDEEIGLFGVVAESIQSFITKSKIRNRRGALDKAFVVVDEAQTIDFLSLCKLLKCLPVNSRICFVGDHRKLPPLGPGNMFQQLISNDSSYVSRLKHCYESAPSNGLDAFRTVLSITDKQFDIGAIPNEEFTSLESISIYQTIETSHEILSNLTANLWLEAFERYNHTYIVVCANASICEKINEQIQQVRFYRKKIPSLSVGEKVFYESDPVLFKTKNTFLNIAPGEFAFIQKIYEKPLIIHGRECLASISMGGEIIEMSRDDMDCLSIGYAITAHKLLGKNIDRAIALLHNNYLINKAWLYTVVAAIRESMILVGSRDYLEKVVSSAKYSPERYFGIPLMLQV
jgi:exodeoxyribonuclease V alpha subunit